MKATLVGLICEHFGHVAGLNTKAGSRADSLYMVLNNTLWLLTHQTAFVRC